MTFRSKTEEAHPWLAESVQNVLDVPREFAADFLLAPHLIPTNGLHTLVAGFEQLVHANYEDSLVISAVLTAFGIVSNLHSGDSGDLPHERLGDDFAGVEHCLGPGPVKPLVGFEKKRLASAIDL